MNTDQPIIIIIAEEVGPMAMEGDINDVIKMVVDSGETGGVMGKRRKEVFKVLIPRHCLIYQRNMMT